MFPNIHPNIEKFWTDQGFRIEYRPYSYQWIAISEYNVRRLISYISVDMDTLISTNLYSFSNMFYTEEEMLKIIKLKAFI